MLLASDYDKSKYFRAEDLKRDTKFRIKAYTEEVLEKRDGGKPEKKLTLWFTTSDQGLVLNKTNLRTVQGAFGDPLAGWIGKIIVVFPTTTNVGGKMTPCLRVRIPPPKQTAAAPQQPVTSGNGAAAAAPSVTAAAPQQPSPTPSGNAAAALPAAAPVAAAAPLAVAALAAADPELDPDPVKLIGDELDDEIPY